MRMEMIRLEHVTKSFGRYKALDDVSIFDGDRQIGMWKDDDASDDKRIAKAGFGKSICGRGRRRRGRFDPASKKDRLRDTK